MKKAPEVVKAAAAATTKPAAAAPKKDAKAAAAPAKKAEPAKKDAKAAAAPAKKAEPAKKEAPKAAAPAKKVEAAKPAEKPVEKKAAPAAKPAAPKPKKAPTAGVQAGKVTKKQVLRGKGQKKKKVSLRFGIDCTNIAEDNIMDVADFVSKTNGLHSNYKNQLQNSKFFVTRRSFAVLALKPTILLFLTSNYLYIVIFITLACVMAN